MFWSKQPLRSIGLIPMPQSLFKGFTLHSESFEGCRGPNNCFLKCPSALSSHAHTEAPSSCKESAQRIMGARSVHQLYPSSSKSFIPKGPLKWPVLSTSVWNDPSIWRPWLFSPRAIDPVWNAPLIFSALMFSFSEIIWISSAASSGFNWIGKKQKKH